MLVEGSTEGAVTVIVTIKKQCFWPVPHQKEAGEEVRQKHCGGVLVGLFDREATEL